MATEIRVPTLGESVTEAQIGEWAKKPGDAVKAGETLGGNHRWSWFEGDLDANGTALLSGFRKIAWQGYDIRFPAYSRTLGARYISLASSDFDAALRRELSQDTLRRTLADELAARVKAVLWRTRQARG